MQVLQRPLTTSRASLSNFAVMHESTNEVITPSPNSSPLRISTTYRVARKAAQYEHLPRSLRTARPVRGAWLPPPSPSFRAYGRLHACRRVCVRVFTCAHLSPSLPSFSRMHAWREKGKGKRKGREGGRLGCGYCGCCYVPFLFASPRLRLRRIAGGHGRTFMRDNREAQ